RQIELLKTFADQAVIAIENTRLFNETKEALERQTATANILQIISASPTDVNPVFEAILENACRLCDSQLAAVFQFDGRLLHIVATKNWSAEVMASIASRWPMPPDPRTVSGRVVLTKRVVLVEDVLAEPSYDHRAAHAGGWRRMIGAPMLRGNDVIGVIVVTWREPGPIMPRHVDLLQTFADQAVIAIENTRLFEEVQARTKELQDSLDRQTATSEVLGVISRSPNEVQPVLDTIVATAQRLCQAERAAIWRLEGETFRAVAHSGQPEERVEPLLSARMPVSRGTVIGRATLARRAVQVEDAATDPELVAAARAFNRAGNTHTIMAVPLLLKGEPIGVISLSRTRVAPFDDKQIALVESFADQAVIAIENSRLFEAEQTSKRELTEALEQQTATADVLKVISRSALDVQKVLHALVESAARLCDAYDAAIFQVFGEGLRLVSHHGQIPFGGPVGQFTIRIVGGFIT